MDAGAQLAALADPTRRAIFELLSRGPSPVGQLAAQLPVSRPAVSQHLRVLAGAGLVRAAARGTRRVYSIDRVGLHRLRSWVEAHWDGVLDAFGDAAERELR